jgi:hypothetical protein
MSLMTRSSLELQGGMKFRLTHHRVCHYGFKQMQTNRHLGHHHHHGTSMPADCHGLM